MQDGKFCSFCDENPEVHGMRTIGYMRSPFMFKNGTPRQPSVCSQIRGEITIDKCVFNNPEHALEGLEEFGHIWIFFIFHKNNNVHSKAKVKPPRLNGKKTGVFSTRSPYRPNSIGLTLAKIENIKGATLTVSGIDILDGTPIIDIKPYIPQYDCPSVQMSDACGTNQSDIEFVNHQSRNIEDKENKTANEAEIIHQSLEENKKHLMFENQTTIGEENNVQSENGKSNLGNARECMAVLQTVRYEGEIEQERSLKSQGDCDNGMNDYHSTRRGKPDGKITYSSVVYRNEDTDQNYSDIVSHLGLDNDTKMDYNRDCILKDVADKSTSGVVDRSTAGIANGATASVADRSTTGVVDRSTTIVADRSTTGVVERSTTCVVDRSTADDADNTATYMANTSIASWVRNSPISLLKVRFTPVADKQLKLFNMQCDDEHFRLQFLKNYCDAREAIVNILHEDPRSTYRRNHCADNLYYFTLDILHITCWFDDECVEVVRIQPATKVEKLKR